ncbi:hypothetical protein CK215_22050 [Mesorhizobium sp. WSM3864]|nr:hypothetical protein CK215_22050 [Mesorhizobium sp. WSM3864]
MTFKANKRQALWDRVQAKDDSGAIGWWLTLICRYRMHCTRKQRATLKSVGSEGKLAPTLSFSREAIKQFSQPIRQVRIDPEEGPFAQVTPQRFISEVTS